MMGAVMRLILDGFEARSARMSFETGNRRNDDIKTMPRPAEAHGHA